MFLEIKNLKVESNGKKILKGVNLEIKKGDVQVLLGSNASGKSTLCHAILGNPKYKITSGQIFFQGKDITNFTPEKRVRLGLALSFQSPPAIKGVKTSKLLNKISVIKNSKLKGLEQIFNKHLLKRDVNLDFSGGEKKMSELIQILVLNPKLVIFDEVDSGLDLKKIRSVAEMIKKELIDKKISVLLVTHSGSILNFLKPNITNVMVSGKIVCRDKNYKKVLKTIKKYGYEKCKKCPFLAD
jgi:Fe-S cluster assembly ATP-binding protein